MTQDDVVIRMGAGTDFIAIKWVNTGDVLTITEKPVRNNGHYWGKCEYGWIPLDYTDYYTNPDFPREPEPLPSDIPPANTYGTVTYSFLRIRAGAGTTFATLGQLSQGDQVLLLEIVHDADVQWGRFYAGWICLTDYVKVETLDKQFGSDTAEEPPAKVYGTVIPSSLNIREKPNGTLVGKAKKGERVEILEQAIINGVHWGRFEGGWICLSNYVELEFVKSGSDATPPVEPAPPVEPGGQPKIYGTVTGTDELNIRLTVNGIVCGALFSGDRVEILEIKSDDEVLWGRYEGGWFCITGQVTLESTGLTGDVTGDGVVNVKDFARLLRHINKTDLLSDSLLINADVTGDGVVNLKDFARMLKHINKTDPLF